MAGSMLQGGGGAPERVARQARGALGMGVPGVGGCSGTPQGCLRGTAMEQCMQTHKKKKH